MVQNEFRFEENLSFQNKLKDRAKQFGYDLSEDKLKKFDMFYQMMVEKNKVMNLTAITEEDEVIDKHFLDSLSSSRVIDFNQTNHVIDIGTGAGFPGIPLKIAFPEVEFVLLDSLQKRVNFLGDVIEKLGLEKITAIHGRAEDIAREKKYRGCFDLCVSRAVANLSTLTEYCIPFVKTNGYFVSYKSQKGKEELEAAKNCFRTLGCKLEKMDHFQLDENDTQRLLLKIKKCKGTPKMYPRKAGVPSKNPL